MGKKKYNYSHETWFGSAKLIGIQDIAKYMSVGEHTVRNWIAKGLIPYVTIGKRKFSRCTWLDEYLFTGLNIVDSKKEVEKANEELLNKSNDGDDSVDLRQGYYEGSEQGSES